MCICGVCVYIYTSIPIHIYMIEKQHCSCLVHHTSDLQIANTSFAGEIPTDQFKKHPITKLGTYSDRPISCISDLFWEQA